MTATVRLFLVSLLMTFVLPEVVIEPLSTVYLPYDYSPPERRHLGMTEHTVVAAAYDSEHKFIYAVGDTYLHVINASDPENLQTMAGASENLSPPGSDVKVCGEFLLVTTRGTTTTSNGKLWIYEKATQENPKLSWSNLKNTGPTPIALAHTRDCRRVVVVNQGLPGKTSQGVVDPRGSLTIFFFPNGNLNDKHSSETLDFAKFDVPYKASTLAGIRWVYKTEEQDSKFSRDLQPQSITLNEAETRAYVSLQINNAIAEVDLVKPEIVNIFPLGYKTWNTGFDASDRDGGIVIKPWPVRGLYQPDGMHYFQYGGEDFIVTANEGAPHRFIETEQGDVWTDQVKASFLVPDLDESVSEDLRTALMDDSQLGRLRVTTKSGYNNVTRKFENIYTFGGRGFSYWKVTDFASGPKYDSGDEVEQRISTHYPRLFNSYVGNISVTPEQSFDSRSNNRGPEIKSVDMIEHGGKRFLFFASETVNCFLVYSFDESSMWPVFETIYRPGDVDKSWEKLYEEKKVGDVGPILQVLPAERSPTGSVVLLVIGRVSGTVSLYTVSLPTTTSSGEQTTVSGDDGSSGTAGQRPTVWWTYGALMSLLWALLFSS